MITGEFHEVCVVRPLMQTLDAIIPGYKESNKSDGARDVCSEAPRDIPFLAAKSVIL